MRKLTLALVVAGSAIAAASPASAQYYPQPGPYGYSYGYNNGSNQARSLEQRIYNVLRSLDGVRPDQRYQIRSEAISLDRQLRYAQRNGLNPYEAHFFDIQIGRLERRQHWASMNGRYGYDQNNGYYGNQDRYDRDHQRDRDDENDDGN